MARRKTLWTVFGGIVLVVVGAVAWWLLSPLFINKEVEETFPTAGTEASATKIRSGNFRDADSFHKGSGQAIIYRLANGSRILRLENFKSTNGPALHVLLASHPNPQKSSELKGKGFVDLGDLKGNIGNQNYPIPAGVNVSKQGSAIIYCKTFSVIFSVASLK
ncbi:MAG: DM13 domain-containing protein [Nitrospinota bacterium]